MKLIFFMFLWFSTTVLLAENNNTGFQAQVQELKTQNEYLKKDLEVATKKFELLENKITYKSENLDDLAKQIKINEENFNKTFNLYYCLGIIIFILIIIFGFYKNNEIQTAKKEIKSELDDYKKASLENIQLVLENFKLDEKHRKIFFEDYQNEMKRLYHQADKDKSELEISLREIIILLENRILKLETKPIDIILTQPNNSTPTINKSATDLLE